MILIPRAEKGESIDALETMYPSRLVVARNLHTQTVSTTTSYGFVVEGEVTLRVDLNAYELSRGNFFCVPGAFTLENYSPNGRVVIIERLGYRGMLSIGRIERKGRLSYIDGCSDTLLVAPPRQGDPCFNFLHFPPGIDQTQHTHPSIRFGVVAEGRGVAYQATGAASVGWEKELNEGDVFLLEEQELHSFRTTRLPGDAGPTHMNIIAFHPDTDWGATDQNHPMLNRTYIGTTPTPAGQYTAT